MKGALKWSRCRVYCTNTFYTYGRYVHSEDTTLKPIMPTCRNHLDKTGQTYNISADSNNTHTVKQAIKCGQHEDPMKHFMPHSHSSKQTSVL